MVRRPCDPPPPPRASRIPAGSRRVAAPEGLPSSERRCTGGDRARGPQTVQSPPESAFLAAVGRLATKTWSAGGAGGGDPSPGLTARIGDKVCGMAPLCVEFMQALPPHFYWNAASLRCSMLPVAERTGLWLNRVFDTAEDYRLLHALPTFLEALRGYLRTCGAPAYTCLIRPFPGWRGTWATPSSEKVSGRVAVFPSPRTCGILWSRSFTGTI